MCGKLWFWCLLGATLAGLAAVPAASTSAPSHTEIAATTSKPSTSPTPPPSAFSKTRLADGFDFPVGKPDGDGYYKSRGFRAGYHMGEDWNGIGGGNTDLGAPVYVVANGIVVFALDMGHSWGNLVIVRHEFRENGAIQAVDSVYAHLDRILVKQNQQLARGEQVGTIGTAHGTYPAHLHFELRKNLAIGFNQRGFGKDLSNYLLPTPFIMAHRKLDGGGRVVPVMTATYGNGVLPGTAAPTPFNSSRQQQQFYPTLPASQSFPAPKATPGQERPAFHVDRFGE